VTARPRPTARRLARADTLPAQTGPLFPPDLDWLPRPSALQQNPELATLAVLHTTLETLVLSLVAFYPQLATLEPPPDRETLAAHRLMVSAWHFQHRLTRYCRDLAARRAPTAPPVPSPDDALF
jgi:hypothetical protein